MGSNDVSRACSPRSYATWTQPTKLHLELATDSHYPLSTHGPEPNPAGLGQRLGRVAAEVAEWQTRRTQNPVG